MSSPLGAASLVVVHLLGPIRKQLFLRVLRQGIPPPHDLRRILAHRNLRFATGISRTRREIDRLDGVPRPFGCFVEHHLGQRNQGCADAGRHFVIGEA
jgi:hypothetical protein